MPKEQNITLEFEEKRCSLHLINPQEYSKYRKDSIPIQEELMESIYTLNWIKSILPNIQYPHYYMALKGLFGESDDFYDDYKCSFGYLFLVKIEESNYTLNLTDNKGCFSFYFRKLFITANEFEQYRDIPRDIIHEPFNDFSKEDMKYKIFCDESNHLLNTKSNLMVNGAILVDEERDEEINRHIKYLKRKYDHFHELKWTKLLNSKRDFYKELIDYFFESEMRFKATFIPNKKEHTHSLHNNSHDEFYYIVYFYTMRNFMNRSDEYKIYLDYKDINGGKRIKKLKETLGKQAKSCDIYIIQSQESQILQLCDIFIGAIGYKNRTDLNSKESEVKLFIIEYLEEKLGYPLVATAPWVEKFNIFRWYLG